jgi:hypothetical protein
VGARGVRAGSPGVAAGSLRVMAGGHSRSWSSVPLAGVFRAERHPTHRRSTMLSQTDDLKPEKIN